MGKSNPSQNNTTIIIKELVDIIENPIESMNEQNDPDDPKSTTQD